MVINKKEVFSWALFDFANSAYALIILTFAFPIYYKEVLGGVNGDFWWGLTLSTSVIICGFISPIIGAITDYDKRKKIKFVLFTLIAILGTASLYFTSTLFIASVAFILTNIFYELAVVLYDSMLSSVSKGKLSGTVSGLGWGLGYLGGALALLLLRPLYSAGFENLPLYKLTFPLTALFFLIFSIPSFIFIKEKKAKKKKVLLRNAFRNVLLTLKDFRKYKHVALFFLGFYLMTDALATVFAFISIYGRSTFSISFSEITIIFLLVQLVGFPASVFLGWLSDKVGCKRILMFTLSIWMIIILMLVFGHTKQIFYLAIIPGGLVMGSSQAVARSWLSKIVPEKKRTEFFGFNSLASKVSAAFGPIIFGTLSVLINQRVAMLSLFFFFLASLLVFMRVRE